MGLIAEGFGGLQALGNKGNTGLQPIGGGMLTTPAIENEGTKLITPVPIDKPSTTLTNPISDFGKTRILITPVPEKVEALKWVTPIAGDMFQQLFITKGGDKGKIVPSGAVNDILNNGLPEQNHPTIGNLDDLEKVNLNDPNDIANTIYNKELAGSSEKNKFNKEQREQRGQVFS